MTIRFSEWEYRRPDYLTIKKHLKDHKKRMQNASSYEEFRSIWLDVKAEVEYMEYQGEIIYIRHLCGIDYEKALKEVELQNLEEPEIYSLRDECSVVAKNSQYREELEKEFGKIIFQHIDTQKKGMNPDSLKLKSKELQLTAEYRQLMAAEKRDDDHLYLIFEKLIETRIELADSLGYQNYVELGYENQCRFDYGTNELRHFREQIKKSVVPVCAEIRQSRVEPSYPPAVLQGSEELIPAIVHMFQDLSDETGNYIEEITQKGLYDLEHRRNKRNNIFSCCMLPCEKVPFIIGSYHGDGMETGYTVHEFGHGFAFYTAAREQALYELHRSSPAVNEIHSKTMEHFMYPYLKDFVGAREKEYIRNHLFHQLENMAYRSAIDEFEHSMYDKHRMSRKQLCKLWADISHEYMPWNQIDTKEIELGNCWPRQTHIVEKPFYYIEYNIAQVSTYEFYNKMKQNHKQAWTDYVRLCSAGGSKSYFELLDIAHLSNPFLENTVSAVCCPIMEELSGLL